MTSARDVAESYWAAECRRDMAAVMDHYQPDATYQDGAGLLVGRDAIRTFYEGSMGDFPGLTVDIVREFVNGPDTSAFEVHAELTNHAGERFIIEGLIAITVRDGKMQAIRCYEDPLRPA
jgi:ketosteroid isomerase-like protein